MEKRLMINGKHYDWSNVDVKLPGLPLVLQEISYDDELEAELVYGKGHMPKGYGNGNYKASGKVSLLRDDYNAILDYCKAKGTPFFKLFFPSIVVSYGNDGERTRIDEIKNVMFGKRSTKAAQGDKSLKVDLDLFIAGGIYQDGVAPV